MLAVEFEHGRCPILERIGLVARELSSWVTSLEEAFA